MTNTGKLFDVPLSMIDLKQSVNHEELRKRLVDRALLHSTRSTVKIMPTSTTPSLSRSSTPSKADTMELSAINCQAPHSVNSTVIKYYEESMEKILDEANHFKRLYMDAQEQVRDLSHVKQENELVETLTRKLKETESKLMKSEEEVKEYKQEYYEIRKQLSTIEHKVRSIPQASEAQATITQLEQEFRAKEHAYQQKILELTRQWRERKRPAFYKSRILEEISQVKERMSMHKC